MKKENTEKIGRILSYIGLFAVTLLSACPFIVMVCMSTHTTNEIYRGAIFSFGNALMENIEKLSETSYVLYYFNSFWIALVSTLLALLVSCLCGYGLAIYKFRLNKALFTLVMVTMMIPSQVAMIGFVLEMRLLGWNNSHIPLIFGTVAWPFGVFWIRQFVLQSVSQECLECARMEGCNEWRVFFQIGMPFLKPALFPLAMISFLGSWNAFLMPQLLLNDDKLYTLQLGIRAIGNSHVRDIAVQIAGLSLGVVPILLIFVAGSKYFVSGLTEGAVKG